MDITQLSQVIQDTCGPWAALVFAVIGVFAAVATMLPAPRPDSGKTYRIVYAVFSWIGMNFGKAKNANHPTSQRDQSGK